MESVLPLATLALTQLLAVISPGQSFLVISRTALASGRTPALIATLGMGVGSVLWAAGAIAGLAVLFEQIGWLYVALKIAAGLYLLFLAIALWPHADDTIDVDEVDARTLSPLAAFRLGFLTQIANPKVIVFFGSIFVALLPAQPPLWAIAATLAIVFINETSWYTVVSCLFSATKSRNAYLRAKRWIDRSMAGLLALIGGKLIADAQ
jgi:threonine/homoserine/homoserine lactone efflux protein